MMTLNTKVSKILKRLVIILVFSLILLGVGYIIALLISNQFGYNLPDVIFYEGLIVTIIGLLLTMKGNAAGLSFGGNGPSYINSLSYIFLETTKPEGEDISYHKEIFNNTVRFGLSNFTFLLGGIFLILFSACLY